MATKAGTDAARAAEMARRRALGAAIRRVRGKLSQLAFGELLAQAGGSPVPQATISRWEKGTVDLSLEQVHTIETAVGLRAGSLLVEAGYADPRAAAEPSVEAILRNDPKLHPDLREDVVRSYEAFVRASQRAAGSRTRRGRSAHT